MAIQLRKQVGMVAVLACALLILAIPIKSPFNTYDEGFAALNATRVIGGETPYKDFLMVYPPGQTYVLAGLFSIFGPNLLTARIYDILVRFTIAISMYLIAKKLTNHRLALLTMMIGVALMGPAGFYTYAVFPALSLGLWSIYFVIQYVNTGYSRSLGWAGLLVGLSGLFRWDIGLYAGITAAAAVTGYGYLYHTDGPSRGVERLSPILQQLATLAAAILPLPILSYTAMGLTSGFDELWTQMYVYPAIIIAPFRHLAFPPIIPFIRSSSANTSLPENGYLGFIEWFQFYFPIVIFTIAALRYTLPMWRRRTSVDAGQLCILIVTLMGILLLALALNRYDSIHILPSLTVSFLVAVPLIRDATSSIQNRVGKSVFLVGIAIPATVYFVIPLGLLAYEALTYSPLACFSHLERARCVSISSEQQKAVEFIKARTTEGEMIFVGNQQHDRITVNDAGFYFLANRPSATKHGDLYPGVVTTMLVQQEIVRELEDKEVIWVVVVNFPNSNEPNLSSVSSGVTLLDDFIREHYSVTAAFGDYIIMRRLELVQ